MSNLRAYKRDKEITTSMLPQYGAGRSIERSSDFIQACYAIDLPELRAPWGHFYEAVSRMPPCLKSAEQKSELEGRCFPAKLCDAMDAFQWAGETGEMLRAFEEGRKVKTSKGKRILRWHDPMMRPMITFRDVRNQQIWSRHDADSVALIMEILERNVDTFK